MDRTVGRLRSKKKKLVNKYSKIKQIQRYIDRKDCTLEVQSTKKEKEHKKINRKTF